MTDNRGHKNFIGYYTTLIETLQFLIQHQNEISDVAMIAAKRKLVALHSNICDIYKTLPPEQQYNPQFNDPALHVLSEVVFLSLISRNQGVTKIESAGTHRSSRFMRIKRFLSRFLPMPAIMAHQQMQDIKNNTSQQIQELKSNTSYQLQEVQSLVDEILSVIKAHSLEDD